MLHAICSKLLNRKNTWEAEEIVFLIKKIVTLELLKTIPSRDRFGKVS